MYCVKQSEEEYHSNNSVYCTGRHYYVIMTLTYYILHATTTMYTKLRERKRERHTNTRRYKNGMFIVLMVICEYKRERERGKYAHHAVHNRDYKSTYILYIQYYRITVFTISTSVSETEQRQ